MLVGCLSLWDRLLLECVYRVGLLSLWDRLFLKCVYGGGLLSLWVELVGGAVLKAGRTMGLAPPPQIINPVCQVLMLGSPSKVVLASPAGEF